MPDDSKQAAAVYAGWATFGNALDRFKKSGVPTRIDKSVFVGQSFGVQSQLVAGFKFLGLAKDNGDPTEELAALAAADTAGRKPLMAKILRRSYANVFALDLMKASPDMFKEAIAKHNVSGDTREKAIRFFLQAAIFAEIPLSPLLTKRVGNESGGTGGRVSRPRTRRKAKEVPLPPPPPPSTTGTAKTVALRSGGTLTLSASIELFALNQADRTFVFELIDKLDGYEAERQKEGEP